MSDTVLLDGAVGTSLWEKTENKVPVWRYNIENPEIVYELHKEYIAAGSKMILCNTFGANRGALRGYNRSVNDVVSEAVRIAKDAVKGTDVKTILSAGPLMMLLEPYGDLTEEEATDIYTEMLTAGMSQKPDCIFLQTFMDVELMKVACTVARRFDVPLFTAFSFEPVGKTMMGNSVEQIIEELEPFSVDAIGLNCSLGPDTALPIIEKFKNLTDTPLVFKPNAGKPKPPVGGVVTNDFDETSFAEDILKAAELGVKYVGGCCGTNAKYIKKANELLFG